MSAPVIALKTSSDLYLHCHGAARGHVVGCSYCPTCSLLQLFSLCICPLVCPRPPLPRSLWQGRPGCFLAPICQGNNMQGLERRPEMEANP